LPQLALLRLMREMLKLLPGLQKFIPRA